MIFGTWRSCFISWQIFDNKVWCPISKKRRRYFHFLLSLAYPIDRLDWALFSVVILFHHWFPLLEKVDIRAFILPRNFPAVLIIFTGRGGAGNPPPSPRGGASFPALHHQASAGVLILFLFLLICNLVMDSPLCYYFHFLARIFSLHLLQDLKKLRLIPLP